MGSKDWVQAAPTVGDQGLKQCEEVGELEETGALRHRLLNRLFELPADDRQDVGAHFAHELQGRARGFFAHGTVPDEFNNDLVPLLMIFFGDGQEVVIRLHLFSVDGDDKIPQQNASEKIVPRSLQTGLLGGTFGNDFEHERAGKTDVLADGVRHERNADP